ncbi:ABC transporter permease subunit [Actinomyces sp. 565]|uniref:ABC transporter permease subunit n=1 Tax=Actinomyces sp. 565 TaxID=2057794 RepID=UPI0013A70AA6|nr:ABC transporter permease subunit [Actinomyces sp. 565]NDR52951.1 ABC transporter permease subunit [Actinomyces sp. 565]
MTTTALSHTTDTTGSAASTGPADSRAVADSAVASGGRKRTRTQDARTEAGPPQRSASTRPAELADGQTFARAVHAEWIKVASLRSTWITSLIAVAITVLFSTAISIAYASIPEAADSAADAVIAGNQFGQIVVAVLGALIITGEYSSGQIRSSLAAVPHRWRLLLAKAIVVGALSFAIGAVSTLLTWAVSTPFMDGHGGSLTDPEYLGFVWGTGLSFAGIALMSLGLGFLLRSTAGAITLAITLLFVVDIPLSAMSIKWDWAVSLQGLEPLQTAMAVYDPFHHIVSWGTAGSIYFLQQWQAALVFGAWALVPLALGWVVFTRRDA